MPDTHAAHSVFPLRVAAIDVGSNAIRFLAVEFVDHHYAHALSAWLHSGFDDAAVLIVDGRGAWEAGPTLAPLNR